MRAAKHLLSAALAACLLLLILGAKWDFIARYGTDMPDWDQWDAEALHLYLPWFTQQNFLSELFHPHNEHRIVFTKLQNLALVLLGGQWDARVLTVTNAVLHGLVALGLFLLGRRWLTPKDDTTGWMPLFLRGLWFVAVVACFTLPLGWENTLGGFHSQQYWLLGFSLTALVLLPFARAWSARWWVGALAATAALGTMGSGLMASAAILLVLGFQVLRRTLRFREAWPTLGLCLTLCLIGWFTRVEVPEHDELKARTVAEFCQYLVQNLHWPEESTPLAGLVFWLPWLVIVWRAWREPTARVPVTLAGLGGWVLLQYIATAYARGAGTPWPAPRYADTVLLGLAINALALLWQLSRPGLGATARWAGLGFVALWAFTLAHGARFQIRHHIDREMVARISYLRASEESMRRYLATGDPALLQDAVIPYPDAAALRARLDPPAISALMPVSLRKPLPLTVAEPAGFAFSDTLSPPYPAPGSTVPGTAPDTPPLPSRQIVGSYAESGTSHAGTWRSAPLIAVRGAWLKFEMTGNFATHTKTSLTLNDIHTGRVLATVQPTQASGPGWVPAYVRAPEEPFIIVATDSSPEHWLAFSAPAEMSALSHFCWQITRHGRLLCQLAAGATALLGLATLLVTRVRTT